VARNSIGGTGVTSTGVADFRDGTLIADLRDLVIGYKDNNGGTGNIGGANGTMLLGSSLGNSVRALNLNVAQKLSDSSGVVTGTLEVGGGVLSVSGDAVVGSLGAVATINTGNATGAINLNGGALDVGGDLVLGSRTVGGTARAIGSLTVTTGSVSVGGNITTTDSANVDGTVLLNGGSLDVTGGSINVDTLTVESGTLKNVAQIYTGDGATTLSDLAKNAGGTLILDGTNTYSGATSVNAGSILVNGSISGVMNVGAAGTVGGTGSILADLNVATGGTVAPGASIGTLHTGNAFLFMDSQFALETDSAARATDVLAVTGSLNIDLSGVKLSITDLNPAPFGGALPFITYSEAWNGGTFTVNGAPIDDYDPLFNPGSTTIAVGGNEYHIDYDYNGDSVALVVPEPTAVLSILGGLGVLLRGRRRNRRRAC
jgi:autotransporter-associated beta strand protein